jgi:hypothetical protein
VEDYIASGLQLLRGHERRRVLQRPWRNGLFCVARAAVCCVWCHRELVVVVVVKGDAQCGAWRQQQQWGRETV